MRRLAAAQKRAGELESCYAKLFFASTFSKNCRLFSKSCKWKFHKNAEAHLTPDWMSEMTLQTLIVS